MRHLVSFLIFMTAAVPVAAQSAGKVAVGASIGTRSAPSSIVDGDRFGVGLTWRLGVNKEGFGWEGGLGWFSSKVSRSFGDAPAFYLGKVHIKPLMVGYGYTHLMGPIAVKGSIQGGYAFMSFDVAPSASDAYGDRLGTRSVTADVSNTFFVGPQIRVSHDLNRKIGINVTTGYMIARPMLTIRTTVGEERQRLRADMFTLKTGVLYSVF
jgi:Outer membrane protein beta-barrel domain